MGDDKIFPFFIFISVWLLWTVIPQPAYSHSPVKFLPGFDGPLPFALETGYIGVDESEDVQLFYYFFPSESNPKEDPLLLWLTGGPGCSTISAILYENGPLSFKPVKYDGSLPRLELNPYSWTKVANIIYLDLPVGTGFSYARTAEATHSGDLKASHNANEFLRKWLISHPEYLSNPVYLAGDSYTGLTLPVYFLEMSQGNEEGQEPFIHLKGYMLGNGATNFIYENNFQVPFAHGMALISDELYESLRRNCKGNYSFQTIDPSNRECLLSLVSYQMVIGKPCYICILIDLPFTNLLYPFPCQRLISLMALIRARPQCLAGIQYSHILEPLCGFAAQITQSSQGTAAASLRTGLYQEDAQNLLKLYESTPLLGDFTCRTDGYLLSWYWMNDKSVQQAIHVKERSISQWIRCNYGLNYTNDVNNTEIYHKNLSERGYRSLIYSGDHDMVVTYLGTQGWIRRLNYPIKEDWRSWFVEGQIAGYTRTYSNNMSFATVKGGGHTAPEYRPKECFAMFKRWISGEPL